MFTAIHPTAYRSGGFLAHGVLNRIYGSTFLMKHTHSRDSTVQSSTVG